MSSLMARLKATQGMQAADNRSKNVVTPEPSNNMSSSSLKGRRPSSSLAAAAAYSGATIKPANESVKYVPQYKKNPLNSAASTRAVSKSSSVTTANVESIPTVATKTTTVATPALVNINNDDVIATKSHAPTSHAPMKMTLIQQLLKHTKTPNNNIPPPFSMCSESEAYDRQQHLELSPFECNPGSIKSGVISIASSSTHHGKHVESMAIQKAEAKRHRPTFNAQYVIKKYRRSAAGGGTLSEASDKCPRTLDQLVTTVDYLLGSVLPCQLPPPSPAVEVDDRSYPNTDPNEISIWGDTPVKERSQKISQEHLPFSLCDTVSFIDDRLRAVQKDLVTLLGNMDSSSVISSSSDSNNNSVSTKRQQLKQQRIKSTVRDMQAKMVRYNILASYLLSDVPSSKYEVQFGARALRTSLTCYLNLSTTIHEEYQTATSNNKDSQYEKECQTQDEIMAYMALLHSSAVLRSEETSLPPPTSSEFTSSLMEDSGGGWGALLSTFCKHILNEKNINTNGESGMIVEKYPRWKWALELACVAQEGNYQRYFTLLENGPTYSSLKSNSAPESTGKEVTEADNARFLILARCCTSHSLNLVRLAQLRRYNHSFGKGEKVSATDLARLLRLKDKDEMKRAELAADLCRNVGLPIVEKEMGDEKVSFVTIKSAPISVKGDESIQRICNPGRMNDIFVFGSKFEENRDNDDVESLTKQMLVQCDVQEDWEDCDDEDLGATTNSTHGMKISSWSEAARKDEDGVLIPSSNVLRNLIVIP